MVNNSAPSSIQATGALKISDAAASTAGGWDACVAALGFRRQTLFLIATIYTHVLQESLYNIFPYGAPDNILGRPNRGKIKEETLDNIMPTAHDCT